MRVLIIGGTGFIGPHVAAHLHKLGHEVTLFHRGKTKLEKTIAWERENPLCKYDLKEFDYATKDAILAKIIKGAKLDERCGRI